jgi:type III secretion protein J
MLKLRAISFLAMALLLASCGGKVELLKDIAEAEANEAIAVLLAAGIASSKIPGKDGVVSLEVDQMQVARAIDILNAEGLPRERFAKMGDVFRKEGLISSPLEERARYIWALSQELSATLAQIDGVIKARVHVVLPEKSTGGDPAMPSSAAVFLKHKQGVALDDSVPQIKRLVSNSIPGLSAEKVTVVMLPSLGKSPGGAESISVSKSSMPGPGVTEEAKRILDPQLEPGTLLYFVSAVIAFSCLLAGMAFFIWKKWGASRGKVMQAVPDKT